MKKYLHLLFVALFATMSLGSKAYDLTKAQEAIPFLKSVYAYESLRESKMVVGGNVINETRTETTYNNDNLVTSVITLQNGQKSIELSDYVYGDKNRTHNAITYVNGQPYTKSSYNDTFGDDFYRNITVSDVITETMGNQSKERIEWAYDENGRIIGMKHYVNEQLVKEQKNYTWTPNSCEYEEITYSPIPSTDKVTKKYADDNYVQNVLEIHSIDMNGAKTESKNECSYDKDGNITSLKSYQNGQLTMEWKDYVWGDKKNTHTEIMYMNGNPMSVTEVTQYYK